MAPLLRAARRLMRILLPDTWHFHRRNFLPLFLHLRRSGIATYTDRSRRRWWKRHGDYRPFARQLSAHLAAVENLSAEQLLAHCHREVPVFACVRAELLCLLLPRAHWHRGGGANDAEAVLRRALADPEDRRDLLLCMAAARDWIDHWSLLLQHEPEMSHVLVYSGSYIYTRTLQEVAQRAGRRLFCLETIFTGNEFYFEERASPIANRSLLADAPWYAGLALPIDAAGRERLIAAAQHRLAGMRNKNVPVTGDFWLPPQPYKVPGVLILGQVLNDFSLIETPMAEASAPATYRRLISGILERTSLPVIFKAHPWERRRPNLGRPLTLQLIETWLATLPDPQRSRVCLLEREPVTAIFPHVAHVVGLCSQGLLEACQAGLRPAQIGRAFFGGKGFTEDYDGPDDFLDDLAAGRRRGTLTMAEYRLFEEFLARALVMHCIPNSPAGTDIIGERLAHTCQVPDAAGILSKLAGTDARTDLPVGALIADVLRNPRPWLHMLRRRPD